MPGWTIAIRAKQISTVIERKYLLSERESFLEQKARKVSLFKTQIADLIKLQKKLRTIQKNVEISEDYLKEQEGKNRVTYLKQLVRDATRETRDKIEEITRLKDITKEELLLLQNQITLNKDNTDLIDDIEHEPLYIK